MADPVQDHTPSPSALQHHSLSQQQLIPTNTDGNDKNEQGDGNRQFNYNGNDNDEIGEDGEQICLLHCKPADLICLKDKEVICSNCALFGEHKGHEVINSQGILTKMTNYIEDCLCVYEDLKILHQNTNKSTLTDSLAVLLETHRKADRISIDDKFNKLKTAIEIEHRRALLKVDAIYKNKQELLGKGFDAQLDSIQQQSTAWFKQIEGLGSMMDTHSSLQKLRECLPYIDSSGLGKQVVAAGDGMVESLTRIKEQAEEMLKKESECNRMLIQMDESLFSRKVIQNLCKIYTVAPEPVQVHEELTLISTGSNALFTSSRDGNASRMDANSNKLDGNTSKADAYSRKLEQPEAEQNLLLQSVQHEQPMTITITPHNANYQYQEKREEKVATEVYVENIPLLAISDIKPLTNVSSYPSSDQSRFFSRDTELQDIINSPTPPNLNALQIGLENQKKRKNAKLELIPQKFKGIIDDLKNDRVDTIDLTGAELGDANVCSLCPFIKKSRKLKVLKLVKNKLGDDCLPELLTSLAESRVTSLNLSQNLLSDKVCQYLPGYNNQYMKTLTLTLNKINRRNAKGKLESLGKRGLNVLL